MADKSRTEQAIVALIAAIDAKVTPMGFPRAMRGEILDTFFENLGDGDGGLINVHDGEQKALTAMVGAASADMSDGYDITHGAVVELMVIAKQPETRDATFDAILLAIHDAVRTDRSLGGVVNWCDFSDLQRQNTNADGTPGAKGAVISVELNFTSNRPF